MPPNLARTILETDSLTEDQRRHLFFFEEDVFGESGFHLTWAPKERFFTVYADGRLVANASVVRRAVAAGGRPVPVVGLGGVVTRPEARGAGHARAAVDAAVRYGREVLGADFAMLVCLPKLRPFYERLGFEALSDPVTIEQPRGNVVSPLVVMVKPLGPDPWPGGPVDVRGKPW
jgi:GNAT superfamily N-acetyltransferase